MVVCVECLPADKPWDVVSVTRRSSGVEPRACVRVYARVLVPPNLYIRTYTWRSALRYWVGVHDFPSPRYFCEEKLTNLLRRPAETDQRARGVELDRPLATHALTSGAARRCSHRRTARIATRGVAARAHRRDARSATNGAAYARAAPAHDRADAGQLERDADCAVGLLPHGVQHAAHLGVLEPAGQANPLLANRAELAPR